MLHNYEKLIVESEQELSKIEREHRHSVIGKRVSMLRKLKSKEARSIPTVAGQLNYSVRQCQRWFKSYQEDGLAAILKESEQGKSSGERMTAEAWSALEESMLKGDIATYRQAREKVAEQGVIYKDDTSMLKLFQRHKIKAKTGRPVHIKADPELQEAFKKTLQIT